MKDFLERVSNMFGGKGSRTYVAAAVAAFVALNQAFGWFDANTMQAMLALAAALGFYAADESPKEGPASS